MRIILLLSKETKHCYVIQELLKDFNIQGIVFENKYTAFSRIKTFFRDKKYNPFLIAYGLWQKVINRRFEVRDSDVLKKCFQHFSNNFRLDESIKILETREINSVEAIRLIKEINPDLIVVFGTSLVKSAVASLSKRGIINVHTGLSPYYRGGQSSFWCLYNDEPEYIGVTIHWLNQGIDSGDIIIQGRPEIEENDTLCSLECKLVFLAVELLKKSILKIKNNAAGRIKQKQKGKLYLSKQFTLDKRLELEKRMEQGLLKQYLKRKSQVYDKVKIITD